MAYDLAKVTTNGNNLIAQILANKSSLSIDKIEISDTQLPSTTDISTMTSVPKVVQTVSANGFSKNSNTLIVSTVVDNSSIRADYKAWVFGIWGSDSQNGQSQLIAVITSTNSPDTIPAFSGRTPVSYTYKFNIGFSNASQIKFKMINGSFATNDTVVHTTGDETIAGKKKFKTDPTDSAGNAYAKTVEVNQQLDKKVNVSDMRKPASDVAGIEEVNAKQDKIGYTPADDSKVVHDNHDGTLKINGHSFTPSMLDSAIGENSQPIDTDVDTLVKPGLYYVSGSAPNNPFKALIMLETKIQYDWTEFREVQISYETENNKSGIAVRSVNPQGNLTKFNIASPWVFLSDDSKVAHLSGANNFDTIPTVNNNPLLLASSLPTDLARLSHDANFTAKLQQNGQDVALANHTIARNPDTGSVSETNTFTAAQTFSIAPTIKDASKDKGDNQAATMADLKSVEADAWHQMTGNSGALESYTAFLKLDMNSKKGYLSLFGRTRDTVISDYDPIEIINLGSIITGISNVQGSFEYMNMTSNLAFLNSKCQWNSIYTSGDGDTMVGGNVFFTSAHSNSNIVSFEYKTYVGNW